MARKRYLTAREAAEMLNITPATLYAYVSRGLIRSEESGEGKRSRRYRAEDVEKLLARRESRQNPEKVAQGSLHYGAPVLESALTLITEGRLYYRGQEAARLAVESRIEDVAALLWTGRLDAGAAGLSPANLEAHTFERRALPAELLRRAPVERFQVALPLAAADDLSAYDLRPAAVLQTGARILALLTAVAAGAERVEGGIAGTLRRGWSPDHPQAEALLNAALILCADHELNVSAFTARVVASAGSTPYNVVIAGLAALLGVKHGGHTERVAALLREAATPQNVRPTLASLLKRGERIPGFGHPLYPDGDPRARALLAITREVCAGTPSLKLADVMRAEVYDLLGELPTIDFALATLAAALELPPGGALALFALGRTVGWLGHALEEYEANTLIRPRARYTGVLPDDAGG